MAPLVGCSKGSGSGGAFVVLDVDPPHNGIVFLNQSLKIRFSSPVDLATANFNSVAFFVQDAVGRQLSEFVVGSFRHGETAGGGTDPRVLEFLPRLATDDRFLNGGFKPARRYKVVLISGANKSQPVLRDVVGHSLSDDSRIKSFEFRSVSGSTPAELFLDRVMGGPRVTSVDVTPQVGARVGLNALGGAPVEVAIEFNQPLNPHSSNVLLNADPDPRRVARRRNARIRLEYDDPELGKRRWIPALLDMPRNDRTGATVIVRPDGVLPNDAAIRVVVENDLEDLAGGHNRSEPLYERVVATFTTLAAHDAQFDAVVLAFENADLADLDAPFRDPVADIKNGLLQATFDFEGDLVPWTFHPTTRDVVLNTDITQVPISNGPPLKVVGGVFRFHDVIIDKGKIVRGTGTNPMVILCSGSVRVDGTLSVSGSTGSASSSFRTAYIPVAGGAGVCGGGHGGKGSPSAVTSSPRGEAGFGPFGRRTGGGEGGRLACQNGQGSGGGGGGAATQGDPDYYDQKGVPYNGTGGSGGPA
ncbi:MAG: hypothetical protein CMJ85_10555, partial [Planctomycetes bacterium]|nr:hypothetical protein [Planctomycetota bacterium]